MAGARRLRPSLRRRPGSRSRACSRRSTSPACSARCRSLLLARGVDPLRVGGQARLVCGHRVALPLAELGELSLELALTAVEIRGPRHQPLFQPLLYRRDCVGELDARAFGLALDCVPPLLCQTPLLFAELVARVRPLSRKNAFELQN